MNRINIALNPDQLPALREESGSRLFGGFLMLFSLAWGGLPAAGMIKQLLNNSGNFDPAMLFVALFPLIGCGVFAIGLNQFFWRRQTRIDGNEVAQRCKSLFRRQAWREPVASYLGVLQTTERRSSGKHSYQVYVVRLEHSNNSHNVLVWENTRNDEQRSVWERWAKALQLPALQLQADGSLTSRSVQDLDKTLQEQLRDGNLAVDFDPQQRAPLPLQVNHRNDGLEIIWPAPRPSLITILVFNSIPLIFIYLGFFGSAPIIFGIVGVLFSVVVELAILSAFITRYRVQLQPGELASCALVPWGVATPAHCKTADIEEISIALVQTGQKQRCVRVSSDAGTITIGSGMSNEVLNWLQDCLRWHATRPLIADNCP